jgi:hypothetical protein
VTRKRPRKPLVIVRELRLMFASLMPCQAINHRNSGLCMRSKFEQTLAELRAALKAKPRRP